jgi:hypothetical protein
MSVERKEHLMTRDGIDTSGRSKRPGVSSIVVVDDFNWKQFTSAPSAVLAVGVSTCPECQAWHRELDHWIDTAEGLAGILFGEITLDQPHSTEFKRANSWLDHIPGLPFTAVFVHGKPVTSLAGTGVHRLESRLRRAIGTARGADVGPSPECNYGATAPCTVR